MQINPIAKKSMMVVVSAASPNKQTLPKMLDQQMPMQARAKLIWRSLESWENIWLREKIIVVPNRKSLSDLIRNRQVTENNKLKKNKSSLNNNSLHLKIILLKEDKTIQ